MRTKSIGTFHLKDIPLKIPMINLILIVQRKVFNNNSSDEEIRILKEFIKSLNDNKDYVILNGVKFDYNPEIPILCEYFSEEGNAPFDDINNKVIIDVGANIADTSLLFAKEGCQVYAYEPVPPIFEIALKNINLNPNIADKVHLFNYAVSDSEGYVEIKFAGEGHSSGASIYSQGESFRVESVSLNKIISDLENEDITPNLLHMDCEGSEFDIIPNSDLTVFDEIIIEHHQKRVGKNHKILLDSLINQGFDIKNKIAWTDLPFEDMGIIHAVNKKNI